MDRIECSFLWFSASSFGQLLNRLDHLLDLCLCVLQVLKTERLRFDFVAESLCNFGQSSWLWRGWRLFRSLMVFLRFWVSSTSGREQAIKFTSLELVHLFFHLLLFVKLLSLYVLHELFHLFIIGFDSWGHLCDFSIVLLLLLNSHLFYLFFILFLMCINIIFCCLRGRTCSFLLWWSRGIYYILSRFLFLFYNFFWLFCLFWLLLWLLLFFSQLFFQLPRIWLECLLIEILTKGLTLTGSVLKIVQIVVVIFPRVITTFHFFLGHNGLRWACLDLSSRLLWNCCRSWLGLSNIAWFWGVLIVASSEELLLHLSRSWRYFICRHYYRSFQRTFFIFCNLSSRSIIFSTHNL